MTTARNPKLNRKARKCEIVSRNPNGVYRVLSPSGDTYTVDLGLGGTCTCAWGRKGNAGCSHERAARTDWARWKQGREVSFQNGDPRSVARKQHKATQSAAPGLVIVLRDKVNTKLDAEIRRVGQLHRARCHDQDMLNYAAGPEWYELTDEINGLNNELNGLLRRRYAA